MTSPTRPLVVYFPDPKQWFERAVPSARRQEFLEQVEAKFDQLEGPIVLIASRTNEEETEYDDKQKLVSSTCPFLSILFSKTRIVGIEKLSVIIKT
jgi:hypothetical protein